MTRIASLILRYGTYICQKSDQKLINYKTLNIRHIFYGKAMLYYYLKGL